MFDKKIIRELVAKENTVASWAESMNDDGLSDQRTIDRIRDHYLTEAGFAVDRGVVVVKNPTVDGKEFTVCNNPTAQRKMLDNLTILMEDLIELVEETKAKASVTTLEDIIAFANDFDCERFTYIEKGAK